MKRTSFTWRRVRGHDLFRDGCYASDAINQHNPRWCGCCYMVAAVQCVQDRARILWSTKGLGVPRWQISVQTIMDHLQDVETEGWNPCHGGFPEDVLQCMVERSCPLLLVANSSWGWKGFARSITRCPVPNAPFRVRYFRRVPYSEVKRSIYEHGPVILEISAETLKSVDERGVVTDLTPREIDHAVCVVGWTEDCWIVRNSWGKLRAPRDVPKDLKCVSRDRNECDVLFEYWSGDPDDPGFAKLPMTYECLDRPAHATPWMEAHVGFA